MAHKSTDWSQLGGPPLTTDDLRHDYAGIYESIAAFYADGGTTPMILSGGWGTNTWLVINKEVIPYSPPGMMPALTTGWAYYIVVSESSTSVLYQDGTSKSTANKSKVATVIAGDTSAPPAGGILMDSFVDWLQILGARARSAEASLSGTATQFDYTWYYRRNILTNTLHLRGTIVVKAATSATPTNYAMGTLPVGFRPNNTAPVVATYRYHSSTLKDSSSTDFIDTLNGEVRPDGTISFGLRRPDSSVSSYTVTFNTIIPLD